jgi:hypothetical protein
VRAEGAGGSPVLSPPASLDTAMHSTSFVLSVTWPGSTVFTLPFTSGVTLWCWACPSVVEVRLQDPELLIDPARDVGVDRRTTRILNIRGESNVVPQRRGVLREALR